MKRKKEEWFSLFLSLRPNQWIKNLILFAAITFNGKLFDFSLFQLTTYGFFIFCAVSSASYLFNDIIDLNFDRRHPLKKKRPLAAGKIKIEKAAEGAFLLFLFGLTASLFLSIPFFLITATFVIVHILYSLLLKKYAVLDILGIALSFILRAYAGEVLTSYHLPFWLSMTILFVALFVASTKRHAELLREGKTTRPTLYQYKEKLLDFYTSMFGTSSIIAYSLFTFLEEPPQFTFSFRTFLLNLFPSALERKWMIVSIPFFIYGLMRYAQIAYEGTQAEEPEKIVTKDLPLILAILAWGLTIILILYIL